jgi:hypothetical protein
LAFSFIIEKSQGHDNETGLNVSSDKSSFTIEYYKRHDEDSTTRFK